MFCWIVFRSNLILTAVIPLIVLVFCNSAIFIVLRQSRKAMNQSRQKSNNTSGHPGKKPDLIACLYFLVNPPVSKACRVVVNLTERRKLNRLKFFWGYLILHLPKKTYQERFASLAARVIFVSLFSPFLTKNSFFD